MQKRVPSEARSYPAHSPSGAQLRETFEAVEKVLQELPLPIAAIIGFTGTPILSHEKTETREIFGDFIDKNILQDAELDGATVPILYEGRTADGIVKDAPSLEAVFEDMFRDYTPDELAIIKAKYATERDVMEAPMRAGDCGRFFRQPPRPRVVVVVGGQG